MIRGNYTRQQSIRGSAMRTTLIVVALLIVAVLGLLTYAVVQHFSKGSPVPVAVAPAGAPSEGVKPNAAPAAGEAAVAAKTPKVEAAPVAAEAGGPTSQPANTMDLVVVDEQSKEPLVGAQIITNGVRDRFRGLTGENGHVFVPLPPEAWSYFNLQVHPKGYVYKRLYYTKGNMEGAEIPKTYTIEMERAARYRGRVVDDAGEAVGGATVLMTFKKTYSKPHEMLDVNANSKTKPIKTTDNGVFTFTGGPAQPESVQLAAWDYHHVVDMTMQPLESVAKLRDGTATITLKRGVALRGVVVDEKGTPLAGASVTVGDDRNSQNAVPPQKTDDDGKFSYAFNPEESALLTVQAGGCAPELKEVPMGKADQEIKIQLGAPHKFTGKVVDSAGHGVGNATISNIMWRGHRTLDAVIKTDADGRFTWDGAPADAVECSVSAPNLKELDGLALKSSEQDLVVTMKAGMHVHGTVVDAETGAPVESFHIIMGMVWNEGQAPSWQRGMRPQALPPTSTGGKFDFNIDWSYQAYAMRVEANGYYAVESRVFKSSEDDVLLELKMKKGDDVVLTVLSPDGKPVSGAKGVIALPGQQGYVRYGANYGDNNGVVSDAEGHLRFSPQAGEFRIAAYDASGYVEVDSDSFANGSNITLQPWGRIEGQLMIGNKPGANEDLDISGSIAEGYFGSNPASIYRSTGAKTDANGRFVAEHVAPGFVWVNRLITMGKFNRSYMRVEGLEIKAGETAKVTVGGMGRPVIGKIAIPASLAKKTDWGFGWSNANSVNGIGTEPPMPEKVQSGTDEDKRKWFAEFIKTKPGQAYLKVMHNLQKTQRSFPMVINKDGTFRIDDVPAGQYQINANIMHMTKGGGEEYIGRANSEFTVPAIAGGRSDEPLDIGEIKGMMNDGSQ